MDTVNVHVRFNGTEFWWIKNRNGDGPLAPLSHCNEAGDIENMMGVSYAHVFSDGVIRRFRQAIGTVKDLEILQEGGFYDSAG